MYKGYKHKEAATALVCINSHTITVLNVTKKGEKKIFAAK